MINDFDISVIEDEVIGIVRSLDVSKNVYPNRPKVAETASDFVVVSADDIIDLDAYGESIVNISLFAKDINFIKNRKKLSAMYQKLRKGFPASTDKILFDTEWNILGDTPDDYGFHARLIRIKIIVKAI